MIFAKSNDSSYSLSSFVYFEHDVCSTPVCAANGGDLSSA